MQAVSGPPTALSLLRHAGWLKADGCWLVCSYYCSRPNEGVSYRSTHNGEARLSGRGRNVGVRDFGDPARAVGSYGRSAPVATPESRQGLLRESNNTKAGG